jgi:hypothetical protein
VAERLILILSLSKDATPVGPRPPWGGWSKPLGEEYSLIQLEREILAQPRSAIRDLPRKRHRRTRITLALHPGYRSSPAFAASA